MGISVHLSHKPWLFFFFKFPSSYQEMPLHGMTWADFGINLFLIIPIHCWLWIYMYQVKFLFLSLHSLSLYKIFQFYLCEKLPSSWFFSSYEVLRTFICLKASTSSRKPIRYLSHGFPLFQDTWRSLLPHPRRFSRGVLHDKISSFVSLTTRTQGVQHRAALCLSAFHAGLLEVPQNWN